jgi:hypothetical protein
VNGSGFASGCLLVLLGTMIIAQVTGGQALQRLGWVS